MFLGGWQLWIKIFCHPANFFGQNVSFFVAKSYISLLPRTPRNFAKSRKSQKLLKEGLKVFDISKKVFGTVANF